MENSNFYVKQKRNRMLAGTAALSALTVIFAFTRLGMIPWFSGASITICHIPTILATLLFGLPSGLFVGAVFFGTVISILVKCEYAKVAVLAISLMYLFRDFRLLQIITKFVIILL